MILKVINTGSVGNCYVFKSETGEVLIIEAGVKFSEVKNYLNSEISNISGLLITHKHGDHAGHVNEFVKYGIDVYSSNSTSKDLGIEDYHRSKILTPTEIVSVGGFNVYPFKAVHDVETLGFVINHKETGNFLFLTDSAVIPHRFDGLNNIIIEANFCEVLIRDKAPKISGFDRFSRLFTSHLSIQKCRSMLESNNLKQVTNIVLIHLSDQNSNEKQFKENIEEIHPENVFIACKGLEIPFNKYPF